MSIAPINEAVTSADAQAKPAFLRRVRIRGCGMRDHGFERGFPSSVHSSTLNFLRQGKRMFQVAPVQRVSLTCLTGHLDALLASPLLTRLRGLHLGAARLRDAGAAKLAACPNLSGLTSLEVGWCAITDVGAIALAESTCLARLTHLDLRGNRIGPEAGAVLLRRFGKGVQLPARAAAVEQTGAQEGT
jgi:hypothetical protein